MNSSEHVRKAVAGYFNDPAGKTNLTGSDHASSAQQSSAYPRQRRRSSKSSLEKIDRAEERSSRNSSSRLNSPSLPRACASSCWRSKEGTFFESGSSELSGSGAQHSDAGGRGASQPSQHLSIEGHTDSKPYARGAEPTATGSYRSTAPTPPAATCRRWAFARTRSRRFADTPTSASASRRTRSTHPIAASRSSCNTPTPTHPCSPQPTQPPPRTDASPRPIRAFRRWPVQACRWLEWDRAPSLGTGCRVLTFWVAHPSQREGWDQLRLAPKTLSSRSKQSEVEGPAVASDHGAGCPRSRV